MVRTSLTTPKRQKPVRCLRQYRLRHGCRDPPRYVTGRDVTAARSRRPDLGSVPGSPVGARLGGGVTGRRGGGGCAASPWRGRPWWYPPWGPFGHIPAVTVSIDAGDARATPFLPAEANETLKTNLVAQEHLHHPEARLAAPEHRQGGRPAVVPGP